MAAIDTSKEINEEVNTYLKLVDVQSLKEKPSQRLIRSNLINAAGILDEYITETLKKPSKVVTGWIDALLLQKIEYKADKTISNSTEISQVEDPPFSETEKINIQEKQFVTNYPINKKLEKLYKKAEKLTDSGKFRQAIVNYEKILTEAKKNQDKKIETKVYLDKAYIYDLNKDFPVALENYNNAAKVASETGNNRLQALSHYNMGSIYDDFGKIDLALKHYYQALSLDGQVENIKAQSHTLNDVGNIFSSIKKYKKAIEHYQVGLYLTKETNDIEGKAFLLGNIASVFKDTGKDPQALNFYKKSIECDIKTGNLEGYLINYEHAGDVMNKNNKKQKAEKLYKKSLDAAQKLGDREVSNRILKKLSQNNVVY